MGSASTLPHFFGKPWLCSGRAEEGLELRDAFSSRIQMYKDHGLLLRREIPKMGGGVSGTEACKDGMS